jgi:hypothetical protein
VPEEAQISIGYYRGPVEDVLSGIHDARLEGAVLELDALSSDQLYAFIDERTAGRPDLAEQNRAVRHGKFRIGPVTFGPFMHVLPIEGGNVSDLRALMGRTPIDILELNVLLEDRYLVEAPDVGDNEIWVSEDLSPESVTALRAALGDKLEHLRP